MCGINGFTFSDSERLHKMHAVTRHRGPDDDGFFEATGISLAHNRLSIIDLSPAAHQPMTTSNGRFTIVFNGEIYNYKQLRDDLEKLGEKFTSQSDTEVLLAAFVRWGEECLSRLNGIFAFAIWDRDEEKLTLVRDQIGVKPMYYHFDGTRLIFSSELKALLVHDLKRELDQAALNIYFRFLYVPGTQTLIQGVKKLAPGTLLNFQRSKIALKRWWNLEEGEYLTDRAEAVEKIREATKSAVRNQLVSDRPLGVFLSGGIDSTSILGIMSELSSGPIKTFSVGYETDIQSERYNADADLAEQTARHFGAEYNRLMITAEQTRETLDKVAWHMDEPISNHVQSSTYLLAQSAKPHITVALGGDGGDELFGGYSRYWYSHFIDQIRSLPIPFRDQTVKFILNNAARGESIPKFLAEQGLERFLSFMMQKENIVSSILSPAINDPGTGKSCFASYFETAWKDRINQQMAVDVQTWLPDESLARTDRLTMAHGLEERVPLLDPKLVELAFRIPSKWKLGNKEQGKRIYTDAMRPYLTPAVLNQEKRAWMSPMAKWIRGPLLPYVREVLSPEFVPETSALFDFKNIQSILENHVNKKAYALNTIWSLMMFQLWYRALIR